MGPAAAQLPLATPAGSCPPTTAARVSFCCACLTLCRAGPQGSARGAPRRPTACRLRALAFAPPTLATPTHPPHATCPHVVPLSDDSLVRKHDDQLPVSALPLSTANIWSVIRSQKDLNLPAHKARFCWAGKGGGG